MPVAYYLYYPAAMVGAAAVIVLSTDAAHLLEAASAAHSLEGAAERAWQMLLEKLTFSLYSGASEAESAYRVLIEGAAQRNHFAGIITGALVLGTVAQIGALKLSSTTRGWVDARLAWHFALISAIGFAVGVSAPMLTMLAYSDVPVLGTVVLKHDTKSVISTIGALFTSRNHLLAFLLVTFSVVFPIIKLGLMLSAMMPAFGRYHAVSVRLLTAIGKWSMTDVFVVAVLVAFLAMRGDEFSDAQLGVGLYFFAAYCLLSQTAAHIVARRGRGAET